MRRSFPAAGGMILAGAIVLAFFAFGCRDRYGREQIGADDETFARVSAMLRRVREAGCGKLEAILADEAAADLEPHQAAALRAALERLASADSPRLLSLDRFGANVYRAVFDLGPDSRGGRVSMLLVRSGGELLWAGPN